MVEWEAYAQVEPFGQERGDMQAGIIARLLADSGKDGKPRSATEFVLRFEVPGDVEIDREASGRATAAAFRELAAKLEEQQKGAPILKPRGKS